MTTKLYLVEWMDISMYVSSPSPSKAKFRMMKSAHDAGYWSPGRSLKGLRCSSVGHMPPDEPVIYTD